MSGIKRPLVVGITGVLIALAATPVFSESISLGEAGVGTWILVLTGGAVVLMQFIPAAMIFFILVGTASLLVCKRRKVVEELTTGKERALLPGCELIITGKKRK